ncbi:hypothetical protein M422DRAFT_269775 [Sphaerobolus stellatus SS14]|uniref:Uncharacterized protein n=1 Tax=Sphaerobolus stellatus (strain SS14) TaxID=990650 RepID=A0A0C9UJ28_SPHS4|nr:hypothetical protein M422DRAFT_269775 [Sphaerobolus stellatus SS14]
MCMIDPAHAGYLPHTTPHQAADVLLMHPRASKTGTPIRKLQAASELYSGDINNLELYLGLHDGDGLRNKLLFDARETDSSQRRGIAI